MKQQQGVFQDQQLSQAYEEVTKDTNSFDDLIQREMYESMNENGLLSQNDNLPPQKSLTEIMQKKKIPQNQNVVKRYLSCKMQVQEDFEVEEIGNNRFQMKKRQSAKMERYSSIFSSKIEDFEEAIPHTIQTSKEEHRLYFLRGISEAYSSV